MASESEIKRRILAVDTDRLSNDADSVISELDRVFGYVAEMYDDVTSLNGMWKGRANEAFTNQFSKDCVTIKDYINNLKNMAETIKEQSGKYTACEYDVKSYISKIDI